MSVKKVNVYLTEQQIAAVHALAASSGLKFAEVLRRLIDAGLGKAEPRQRGRRKRSVEKPE